MTTWYRYINSNQSKKKNLRGFQLWSVFHQLQEIRFETTIYYRIYVVGNKLLHLLVLITQYFVNQFITIHINQLKSVV